MFASRPCNSGLVRTLDADACAPRRSHSSSCTAMRPSRLRQHRPFWRLRHDGWSNQTGHPHIWHWAGWQYLSRIRAKFKEHPVSAQQYQKPGRRNTRVDIVLVVEYVTSEKIRAAQLLRVWSIIVEVRNSGCACPPSNGPEGAP